MYKDKKTKEIKSFAYLTRKICKDIPKDFYNNLDEKYGLTNIYMLRPYRLNDGYIGLVTTNNIDDYYIVPKGVNIVKCNGSGTTILTMNHNETKKTYYAYEDNREYFACDNLKDIKKVINYRFANNIRNCINNIKEFRIKEYINLKSEFDKILQDISIHLVDCPYNIGMPKSYIVKHFDIIRTERITHSDIPLSKYNKDNYIKAKYIKNNKKKDLQYYEKISQRFFKDFDEIYQNKKGNYEYILDDKEFISGNKQELFKDILKYINDGKLKLL